MKTAMIVTGAVVWWLSTIRAAIALRVCEAASGWAIATSRSQHDHGQEPPATSSATSGDPMSKMHQMMDDATAANERLDALLKDLSVATGHAKIAALTAVVTELAQQQKMMHGHMSAMHGQMMQMMAGRGGMMKKE
jgi:hypothetical protein